MNSVYRRGDTVVRVAGPWTPTVHRYLNHLAKSGVQEIPRPLGVEGRHEVLTFVEGDVPEYPLPSWVWTDQALAEATLRLRELHEASVGFDTAGATWQSTSHEPVEVICHNDFAPHNLTFVGGHVAGVIDFDLCSPGPRIWDLAYLATRMVPLTTQQHEGAPGEDQWSRRIGLLLDSYGRDLSSGSIVRTAIMRLRDLAVFSRAKAADLGKPELNDHAMLYERDADHLETSFSSR